MNPESGFQSGPGDSADADYMVTCLLVTKSNPPLGERAKKNCIRKLKLTFDINAE